MQAKQIAKAMAEAKENQEKGDKFLAENGKASVMLRWLIVWWPRAN